MAVRKILRIFAASNYIKRMSKSPKYIITGINRLSRQRVAVTRPMAYEAAEQLLFGYRNDRSHRGHRPYLRLRIERVQPIQLSIKFPEYDS